MIQKEEKKLITQIKANRENGKISSATLQTDDRVLARITDGIYRQPASALRELISNAYDADATNVVIQTDAPRFDRIIIRDDGHGMDIKTLARLIYHIGGSAKRLDEGIDFGIGNKKDPSLSPKGRRLIGKIGIGLFSVAQLTRHFQIITKVKGAKYRLIAEVVLKTYSEDEITKSKNKRKRKGKKIDTGAVKILSVPASDKDSYGTEIILLDLRPQAKDLLRSKEMWDLSMPRSIDSQETGPTSSEPIFHIGRISDQQNSEIQKEANLPWTANDKPEEKFKKLYQSIIDEIGTIESRPRLEATLDNYLRMLWTLSLSAPINYIDKHPFDLVGSDYIKTYEFSSKNTGQAQVVKLKNNETLRKKLKLKAPERGNRAPFSVIVDDIQLLRPIRFKDLPTTAQALKEPILFVGKASPNLKGISTEERGGDLSFEAYFLWAPKIVPKENNGLLIRIGDASGTLFDETFAKYQVQELTRLKQITAEIYVSKGLDAAMNIDRESFNYAHPHYQYIMRWTHRALRQLTNTHKKLASDIRGETYKREQGEKEEQLEKIVEQEFAKVNLSLDTNPTDIEIIAENNEKIVKERHKGKHVLNAYNIFPRAEALKISNNKSGEQKVFLTNQVKAIAQILDAYGLLEKLTYKQQEELLSAITAVFLIDRTN